jgi:hypothetical protein
MKTLRFLVVILAALIALPALAADKPASNMDIVREKVKADKKLLVAANMELTETEAKGFWPVYEAYQTDLAAINARLVRLIKAYADQWNAKSLTDDSAKQLLKEMLAIEAAEVSLREAMEPKLLAVLPGRKVARYMQIENKIRAAIKYELAEEIPLVP